MIDHAPDAAMAIWTISALATAGVIVRPLALPEAIWAILGVVALLALRLIGFDVAVAGVRKGTDVYLFLTGMMLLAETARLEGLFDWLAALATRRAAGSAKRLFTLIFGVGIVVTTFMSNDATAVVLTPAVAAAIKAAKIEKPLPFLFICAFIANAASFVLPISNPANLVIYGARIPPLLHWLPRFALPSVLSILATYAILRCTQNRTLSAEAAAVNVETPALSVNGKLAAAGLAVTAIVLLSVSGFDRPLGLPTAICGLITAITICVRKRCSPWVIARDISWGVLPLVAGLFVFVEALNKTALISQIGEALGKASAHSANETAAGAGTVIALLCNIMNNLPAGLIAGSAVQSSAASDHVTSAILVGVDLGPNLSVTGSLATILWLSALHREGISVSSWSFLKLGLVVMPPALVLALVPFFLF